MAEMTQVERWEDRATLAFFFALATAALGSIFFVWVAPQVNAHSLFGIFWIGGMLLCGLINAGAGLSGGMAAGVLFFKYRVISWRGALAGIVAGGFLFVFR